MASTKKISYKLLEINALGRLKMLFQIPYILKSSGGACPRTPLAAQAFGARDQASPNKSNLATALRLQLNLSTTASLGTEESGHCRQV